MGQGPRWAKLGKNLASAREIFGVETRGVGPPKNWGSGPKTGGTNSLIPKGVFITLKNWGGTKGRKIGGGTTPLGGTLGGAPPAEKKNPGVVNPPRGCWVGRVKRGPLYWKGVSVWGNTHRRSAPLWGEISAREGEEYTAGCRPQGGRLFGPVSLFFYLLFCYFE